MKLTVKLDFGGGREIKVGTFSEIARDTVRFVRSKPGAFSFAAGRWTEDMRPFRKHGHVRAFRRFATGRMGASYS